MIEFNEDAHTYSVDGDTTYISVTTLLSSWFAPFDVDKVIKSIRKNKNEKYESMTDEEIKTLWKNDGKLSADLGTSLHKKIEMHLSGEVSGDTDCDTDFQYFLNFIRDHPLTVKSVEWRLFDTPTKLIGSIDCVTQNEDGSVNIYDWKRVKNINSGGGYCQHPLLKHIPGTCYWKYTIQLNLYRYLLESNGYRVKDMYIVIFYPGNIDYIKYTVGVLDLTNVLKHKI